MLLAQARRLLAASGISRLYSGADLSRPTALAAHQRWGFRRISRKVWAGAGLAWYAKGDVSYMLLEWGGGPEAVANKISRRSKGGRSSRPRSRGLEICHFY